MKNHKCGYQEIFVLGGGRGIPHLEPMYIEESAGLGTEIKMNIDINFGITEIHVLNIDINFGITEIHVLNIDINFGISKFKF